MAGQFNNSTENPVCSDEDFEEIIHLQDMATPGEIKLPVFYRFRFGVNSKYGKNKAFSPNL